MARAPNTTPLAGLAGHVSRTAAGAIKWPRRQASSWQIGRQWDSPPPFPRLSSRMPGRWPLQRWCREAAAAIAGRRLRVQTRGRGPSEKVT
eukprot:scaffold7630_cov122-Isochrysis_galbana.AAC.9